MYWLIKNNLIVFNKSNIFSNFFFINNFNYLLFYFFLKNINFKENAIFNIKNKFLNKFDSNIILNKHIHYFTKIFIFKQKSIKISQLNYYCTFNKINLYNFNLYNFVFYKKIINLLFDVNYNNYNFVILDKSYKNIFPLYNYIFGLKNLEVYRQYFFINSYFFTYNNWYYFYNKFFKKFNVILILILDYYHFCKFFKILRKMNLPISTILPINNLSSFIDYPIYVANTFNFEKFIFLNIITQTMLLCYNYKNYNNKIKFLKIFYEFYLKNLI